MHSYAGAAECDIRLDVLDFLEGYELLQQYAIESISFLITSFPYMELSRRRPVHLVWHVPGG